MKNLIKIFLAIIVIFVFSSCEDEDKNPLIPESEFIRVGILDEFEYVEPSSVTINLNNTEGDVLFITMNSSTNDVDSYTLLGDLFNDPQGNDFRSHLEITVTEFPTTIALTLEELANAFGQTAADFENLNSITFTGRSVSNGITVSEEIVNNGQGWLDSDSVAVGFPIPYRATRFVLRFI